MEPRERGGIVGKVQRSLKAAKVTVFNDWMEI